MASLLDSASQPQISLLTNLAVDSLLQGSVDGAAIAEFCREVPTVAVRHLPGLHAKAYVADDRMAIVTSGNLTSGSLHRNYEYGIQISDPLLVRRIASDLQEYGSLGVSVSIKEMDYIAEITTTLREKQSTQIDSARADLRQEFEDHLENVSESVMQLRGKLGESTNSIFARTILYLLRGNPMTTQDINERIRGIHPDLCNDGVDRVINGVRFGKKWKHSVRNAQQFLKRGGQVELVEGYWRVAKEK